MKEFVNFNQQIIKQKNNKVFFDFKNSFLIIYFETEKYLKYFSWILQVHVSKHFFLFYDCFISLNMKTLLQFVF